MLIDSSQIPDLPFEESREYLFAQNYLIKLENNLLDINNLSDKELEEKRCFENYYSKVAENMRLSLVGEAFISEKGFLLKDMLKDFDRKSKEKQNIYNSYGSTLNISPKMNRIDINKRMDDLEKDIEIIIEKHNLDFSKLNAKEDKYIFDPNYEDDLYNRDLNNKQIISPLKEPNIREGVKYGKYRIKRYKVEDALEEDI